MEDFGGDVAGGAAAEMFLDEGIDDGGEAEISDFHVGFAGGVTAE